MAHGRAVLVALVFLALPRIVVGDAGAPTTTWRGAAPSGPCVGSRTAVTEAGGAIYCCISSAWQACGTQPYVHPAAHPPAIISQDASNRFVTDAEKATWSGKLDPGGNAATATALAANGANCSSGQAAQGVSASGAAEGCTVLAPTGSGYITKTADSTLSNEFALGSLATGILKNTTTTGVPSIAVDGTDFTSPGYVQSRGMNLVTNGSGLLGNNFNFSTLVFTGSEAYSSAGSFYDDGLNTARRNDEFLPVDAGKTYELRLWAKAVTAAALRNAYFGGEFFDVDKLGILPYDHMFRAGTQTTLAAPLTPGDTVVQLASAANWYVGATGHMRSITVWGYKNSLGYRYPDFTYSRLSTGRAGAYGSSGAYAEAGISGNTVTLRAPWPASLGNPDDPSGTWPAGTAISNGLSGGNYKYFAGNLINVPLDWTQYRGTVGGVDLSGTNVTSQFPPGAAYMKLLFLLNRDTGGVPSRTYLANLWFSEIAPANLIGMDGYVTFAGATGAKIGSSVMWHAGNDGAASTLDADLLDGKHAASFSGTGTCAANQWARALNGDAAPTCSQPGFSDLSGTASVAQGGTGNASAIDDTVLVGNGTTWQGKPVPACTNAGHKLAYDAATNSFTCQTSITADVLTCTGPCVSEAEIEDGSITAYKIDAAAVQTNHLATNVVTADKILAGEVTLEKLSFAPVLGDSVVASINASAEGIRIASSKVHIDGSVTFGSGYDPTTKATPSYVDQAEADAISASVSDIKTLYGHASDTTKIDGGNIYTGSITAAKIAAGSISVGSLYKNYGANLFPNGQSAVAPPPGASAAMLDSAEFKYIDVANARRVIDAPHATYVDLVHDIGVTPGERLVFLALANLDPGYQTAGATARCYVQQLNLAGAVVTEYVSAAISSVQTQCGTSIHVQPGVVTARIYLRTHAGTASGGGTARGIFKDIRVLPQNVRAGTRLTIVDEGGDNWISPALDIPDTGWVNATLNANYANAGGSWPPTRYRRIGGIAYVQIATTRTTAATSPFTLPVGYRPSGTITFSGWHSASPMLGYVHSSGVVEYYGSVQNGQVANFSFPVDQ